MNNKAAEDDSYHSLLLLEEIAREESVSQRELSKRLGIALGLVNSYVRNMISKGYIRVSSFPRNRYKYLLTPKGIAEKSRLTYQHLHYFTNLYTTARKDFKELFNRVEKTGVKKVIFCGIDEVAEIAYISLQETGIELEAVMDDEQQDGKTFFNIPVVTLHSGILTSSYPIIITSLKKSDALMKDLLYMGAESSNIHVAGLTSKR